MNTRKMVLFIATSLDGYIAKPNGDINWLYEVNGEGDNGFAEFYETTDTLVMGKKSFDHVMEMTNQQYPHSDRVSYVFTSNSKAQHEDIHFTNEDVVEFTRKLKSKPGKNIWLVGGAQLLDVFMKNDLVDEWIITTAPILLGSGIPLFKEGNPEIKLSLTETKQYGEFVQNRYIKL